MDKYLFKRDRILTNKKGQIMNLNLNTAVLLGEPFVFDESLMIYFDELSPVNNFFPYDTLVELDMNGNGIMSNNLATFAASKEQAKNILGSSEKIGKNELLIADSINKRAIIVNADTNQIIWEYESDRYIVDFHLNKQDERVVSIYDGSVSSGFTYLKQGMNLIWKNQSSGNWFYYRLD
jgi:outer membrane protein assembly factor BamB